MKGDIHNETGTICRAEIKCRFGDGGHSKNIEEFIENNFKKYGYDKKLMNEYAKEGLRPKEILLLAKENARIVATLKETPGVIEKIKNNEDLTGVKDSQLKDAHKKVSQDLANLRKKVGADLDLYDELSRQQSLSRDAMQKRWESLNANTVTLQKTLKNSLRASGVTKQHADYFVRSKLAAAGLGETYNGSNRRTGKKFTIERGDFKQLHKGLLNSDDPIVIKGVEKYFRENYQLINNINQQVSSFKHHRDLYQLKESERQKNYDSIQKRRELLVTKHQIEVELTNRTKETHQS